MAETPWVPVESSADEGWVPVAQPAAPQKSSGFRRAIADPALAGLKGAIGLPEAAVGLADIVTGGEAGRLAEAAGFRPKEAKRIIDTWESPELQQAKAEVGAVKGFFPKVKAMVERPSTIVESAFESAPSMIGGAGVARSILKTVPKVSAVVAAGVGEGVVTAGSTAEQIRQETPDGTLDLKQSVLPVVAGALTGALGIAGGKIAGKLGIGDIDTLLSRGAGESAEAVAKNKNLLRRVAEGAFSEGILEELPQAAQEQVAQNIALGKPWNEGVAEAAAAGMLVGGLMGMSANVRPTSSTPKDTKTELIDALKEAADPTTDASISDVLEATQAAEAQKTADELAPDAVDLAVADDKLAEALNITEPLKPIEEAQTEESLSTDLSTGVENLAPTPQEVVDETTGEITPAPLITDPLDAYRGYASEKSALKAGGGMQEGFEAVQRPSDNKWVRVPKQEPAPVKIYRGELPFKEGAVTGESKGVKTGDFWTTDKGTAEYFAGAEGTVLEAALKPTAKVLDLETPDGQKEYERLTGRVFDGNYVAEQGVSGYTEKFKSAGYDAIHSIDIDGPETLVLNHSALEKTPSSAKKETPQVVTPNQVKGSISVYNVDENSALGYDSDTGVYTLKERGTDGRPVDVATYEVINGKIQNFKTEATARDGFDREQQIMDAQSLVARIENGRSGVKFAAKGQGDAGRDENTVGSEVAGRDGGKLAGGAERPVNNPLLNADGSNKYSAEDALRVAEKEIEKATGKRLPYGSLRVVPGTDHLSVKLNKIASVWGKRVVVFEAASGVTGAPGGFRTGLTADTLYINKVGKDPHLVTLGHELTHAIEAESKELYAEFEAVVKEQLNTKAYESYVADYNKMHGTNYTGGTMTSEAIAETVGHLLGDVSFWESTHETHPTLFEKVIRLIHDLLEPIITTKYHAKLTEQIYKDYSKIYKATAKMLSEFEASNNGGMTTQFSAASEAGATTEGQKERAAKMWAEKGVESPFFKKWFGESKVVGDDGKPLVVYHGTRNDFNQFRKGIFDTAIYFTPDSEFASDIAGDVDQSRKGAPSVMPVYLKIENLFDFKDAESVDKIVGSLPEKEYPAGIKAQLTEKIKAGDWKAIETLDVQEAIQKAGYDGFLIAETLNGETPSTNYAVFSPTQIKSATGNQGTFDAENPDIRFSASEKKLSTKEKLATGVQLTDKEFYATYWKHRLGDKEAAGSILKDGFGRGIGPNVTPVVKNPDNVIAKRWQERPGDTYILIPLSHTKETGNGPRIPEGYKPRPYEVLNVVEGQTLFEAYEAAHAKNTTMKFSASLNDVTKTAKAVTSQFKSFPYGQVLEDVANNVYRFLMPVDRSVTLAASQKTFAPIKALLNQFVRQRKEKAGRIQSDMTDGAHIWKRFEKNFKTDAEVQNFSDMVWNATEYELHADGAASGWTAESWDAAGMTERTGKTLGQAKKIVSDQYAKLSPGQKIVHQEMLHHVQQMYMAGRQAELAWLDQAEVKKAEEWLLNEEGDKPELADLVREVNDHYPTIRGDYMPLMRFGSLIVRTYETDENGELGNRTRTEFFDSPQAARDYIEAINKTPGFHAKLETNPEYRRDVVNIPASLVDKITKAAAAQGIEGQALEDLKQSIEGTRANMLPRNSIASSKLHREGVAGYEKDVIRVYLTYVRNHALANAQLTHGAKIEQTFRDMRNTVDAISSEPDYDVDAVRRMSELTDHLYDVEKSGSREKVNEFTKTVGKLTFAWYLSSPSVWAVQWSQPFMVTIPKLGARHGFGKAFAAYSQAAKRFLHGDFSDDKIDEFDRNHEYVGQRVADILDRSREAKGAERVQLDKELKRIYDSFKGNEQRLLILKVLSHQGQIDLAMAHNAQDIVAGAKGGEKVFNSIIDKAAFFMQKSETGSRRAAAVAAFELQYDGKNFTAANDYATHIISDTLMDFDAQNRGTAWRGNTGRILGQFQFFRMHMMGKLIQLSKDAYGGEFKRAMADAKTQEEKDAAQKALKEARKELAYVMGSSFALAGAAGTPLALLLGNTGMSALWGALAFMFGDDDDPWEPQREFELATREALGDMVGNVVLKGLPSLVGADISRRIGMGGMGDVISGEPPAGLTGTAKANWYAGRILGPSWGMVSDTMRASDALADGDLSMALRYSSPKVVRDVVKMFNVADKGIEAGGKTLLKPEDVSMWSMALMLSGVNPTELSLAQEESRYLKNISTELSQRRSSLIRRMAEATVDQDFDAKESAIEKINEWSAKQPMLKITQQELAQKIKKVRDGREGKLTKREALIQDEFGQK